MKKKLFLALTSIMLSLQLQAADFIAGGFHWSYRADRPGEVEVAKPGYTQSGYTGDVVIPPTVTFNNKTYTVTRIGDQAYKDRTAVTSVIFPGTIDEIGGYAFEGCTNLTMVTLPSSVKTLRYGAFAFCTSLESVSLGSVETIEGFQFYSCNKLNSITIPETVAAIGSQAFQKCSLTKVDIPNSVTIIGKMAFAENPQLEVVLLGRGIEVIYDNAFGDCPTITLMISHIEDPQAVIDLVSDLDAATLIVPNGCAYKYRSLEGWSGFERIIEDLPVPAEPVAGDGDLDGSGSIDGTDVSILLEKVLSGN